MNAFRISLRALGVAGGLAFCTAAQSELITNGGFETGFSGWTRNDQVGSDGTFLLQAGTTSPLNAEPVPPPPQGLTAAMTDAGGPGAHVLYQDFVVSAPVAAGTALKFSLFLGNTAPDFFTPSPPTLDFAPVANPTILNQQARVDILTSTSDPFSVAAADVLLNAFQTNPGDSASSAYAPHSIDVTAFLNSHVGQTLRLRFAETDDVSLFNLGVDAVSISAGPAALIEPGSLPLVLFALAWLLLTTRPRGSTRPDSRTVPRSI